MKNFSIPAVGDRRLVRAGWFAALVVVILPLCQCHRQDAPPPPPVPRVTPPPAPPAAVSSPPPRVETGAKPQPAPAPDFEVNAVSTRSGLAYWYEVPERSLPERKAWAQEMTAASDVLPQGAYVRVTREDGPGAGKSVIVRITDRGVQRKDAVVDVSKAAAEALDMVKEGKAQVKAEQLALKNASADKPVEPKDSPAAPKLAQPAAKQEDEKQASEAKSGGEL